MKEYTNLFPEGLKALKEINCMFLNKTHDIQFIMNGFPQCDIIVMSSSLNYQRAAPTVGNLDKHANWH